MSSTDQQDQQDKQDKQDAAVETAQTETVEKAKLADLTPYAASKIVTAMLARAEVPVKVSSQVMYSRASHQVIQSYRLGDGKWMMNGDDFARWAKRYVDSYKNGTAQQTRTDYAALAEQYEI